MPILNMGTGVDGDITFSVDTNLNTTDMPVHAVTGIGTNYVDLDDTTGLSVGDEVLLINTRGILSPIYSGEGNNGGAAVDPGSAGHHETFNILQIDTLRITFGASKQLFYGDDGDSDDNIGDHPVQLQRVPNYNNVTINAGVSVYPNETGRTDVPGGVVFIRVLDTITINGTLHASGRGGDGGALANPPGLGVGAGYNWSDGSGGAYGGIGLGTPRVVANPNTYGDQEITDLHIGSGGGHAWGSYPGPNGGDGGGVVYLHATTLEIAGTGSITCTGDNGGSDSNYGGGGGSGGSVKLIVGTYNQSGTLLAEGGVSTKGGNGGVGRIAVYANVFNNEPSSTPAAYTAEATLPFFIAGSINADAIIRVYDSDTGILVATTSGTGESYSIVAPGLGPYDVMGRPHADSKGALIYKDIIPQRI